MLVRAIIPLVLSTYLLAFGPSAQGDLEIEPPSIPAAFEHPAAEQRAELRTDTGPELAHALLASRLEALDRDIPGLDVR
jgi:hypothetical protein